jgi:hypothetical protein
VPIPTQHDRELSEVDNLHDQVGIIGDLLEPFRPVVAAPGEDLDVLVGDVELDAVAVELDLVEPAVTRRPSRWRSRARAR